jgi:flavin prenyltransferase
VKPIVVALTGASGAVYGIRLVQVLLESGRKVDLVVSDPARLVMAEELGTPVPNPLNLEHWLPHFGPDLAGRLHVHPVRDFAAPIASGSYPVEAMAVVPCSMGTLGAVASGLSQNLIHRAADCVMKEGRRLILVPRETPLHAIHLENMLKLARMGVRIVPAMPGFYSGAKTVEDMVDFVVGKVLDQLEIPHALYPRWIGRTQEARS